MILIIDFGSQTTHLISRRIREMGVKNVINNPEKAIIQIKKLKPKGIIFSGGPSSVYEKNAPMIDKKIFDFNIPILGICYGWQLIAVLLGGKVISGQKEYGPANLIINIQKPLFDNVDSYSRVWMSHGDSVIKDPLGFMSIGETERIKSAAVADFKRNIFGIQFHPEIEHTVFGTIILRNFTVNICKEKTKKYHVSINRLIETIKKQVGNQKVICAVSGGVDSTVVAMLIGKAIGKNLCPIYIESGLMRSGTKKEVIDIFQNNLKIKPIIINVQKLFLRRLKGVTDAEQKRIIIGNLYIKLFEKQAKKIKNVRFLAQGTIYSDVIESKGTKNSAKIKSHHNVGGLPEKMNLKLIEPLRNFYKDEVRIIGRKLGLPDYIVNKQPFPGPGNAIRIMGEITPERLLQQQKADEIILEEIKNVRLYEKVFLSFPVMTGAKSTAVKGDGRAVMEVVALRIIESKDIMSTDWAKIPYEVLQKISTRIVNEVPEISRVVYDITTKPPATMEWE
jgi:GMP synthase (glutamine-hydrolysing)